MCLWVTNTRMCVFVYWYTTHTCVYNKMPTFSVVTRRTYMDRLLRILLCTLVQYKLTVTPSTFKTRLILFLCIPNTCSFTVELPTIPSRTSYSKNRPPLDQDWGFRKGRSLRVGRILTLSEGIILTGELWVLWLSLVTDERYLDDWGSSFPSSYGTKRNVVSIQ